MERPMSEAQLQAAVVAMARLLGWRVYHTYDSRRSDPGFPDLCMVRPPRLIFAELKNAKNQTSAAQVEWLGDLLRVNHETFLWRPDDWLSGRIEAILRAV